MHSQIRPHRPIFLYSSSSGANQVGGPLCNHDGRRIDIATNEIWENRSVNYTQTFDTSNPQMVVNDCHFIGVSTHFAGTRWMMCSYPCPADIQLNLSIVDYIYAGTDLM